MTFGIVTFMRPDKLRRLVQSIRRHHGNARIVIADNGRKLPARPVDLNHEIEGTETHVLPFDCGLSECRNFLLHNTEDDVLILDDDFEFTASTIVQRLQDVLDHDTEVGVVGGKAGIMSPQRFDRKEPLTWRATKGGTRYCLCDITDNFLLVRREAIREGVCWNPGLKVGEHRDFFMRLKQSRWSAACVPDVQVKHERGGTEEYEQFRNRATDFNRTNSNNIGYRPPLVVLGVGHSGTSVVTRILERMGWHLGDVKDGVAEHKGAQQINKRILVRQGVCPCGSDDVTFDDGWLECGRCSHRHSVGAPVSDAEIATVVASLPDGWAIKDPRMVVTLERWMPHIGGAFLLHVERDLDRMRRTYMRHRFHDFRIYGKPVAELQQLARWRFQNWAGSRKLSVRYEQIADAVKLFDLGRVA